MIYFTKAIFIFIISISLISCASQPFVILEGGPDDISAPEIRNVHRKGKSIVLVFNENIQITTPQSIIYNTFPNPKITTNRKKLYIKELPKDSVKVIIQFNQALKDLNNNNTLENYIYTQNTKNDTFSVNGSISVLFNANIKYSNCYVILFDSAANLTKPNAFYNYSYSKTDDSDVFNIPFIPNPSGYKLFTFMDNNNNFMLDSLDISSPFLTIDTAIENIKLLLVPLKTILKADTTVQKIIKTNYSSYISLINEHHKLLINKKRYKDTVFDFQQVSDTIYTDINTNIIPSIGFKLLNEFSTPLRYDSTLLKRVGNTFLLKDTALKKDTLLVFTNNNGDTVLRQQFINHKKYSSFTLTSDTTNIVNGILINASFIYDIEANNKILLLPGAYKLFIFEDTNKNGKFDYLPNKSDLLNDKVLINMKDIDIPINSDVETGV